MVEGVLGGEEREGRVLRRRGGRWRRRGEREGRTAGGEVE